MKSTTITLISLVAISVILALYNPNTTPQSNAHSDYLAYLQKFNKEIPLGQEFFYRAQIFAQFLSAMKKHNSDQTQTWKMGVNQFSDMTKQEFAKTYLGQLSVPKFQMPQQEINVGYLGDTDWRARGVVTAIKNQGKCGSCWAFAATAAHESYHVRVGGQPITINLSQQQLVDCSNIQPYGNNGCNGGYGVRALEYIKDFGQTTTDSYPYQAATGTCREKTGKLRILGVTELTGCLEIEAQLPKSPMAVRVDATNWHSYASGIFDNCESNWNHAVFLVGSSRQAWTVKNSWGTDWGQKGYIRLKKGNTCGICFGPSFPI